MDDRKIQEKSFVTFIVVNITVFVIFLIGFGFSKFINYIKENNFLGTIMIAVIVAIEVILYLVIYKIYYKNAEKYERIESARTAFNSKNILEVIPIRARSYEEFILGMSELANFYATLKDNGYIRIFIKFKNERRRRAFEYVTIEKFVEYYTIK